MTTGLTRTQILASFYFSAFTVFAVVVAGYVDGYLPSNLLRPIDRNILRMSKKLVRSAGRHQRLQMPSKELSRQRRRTEVLVDFVKILSDQQIITGFAIRIALLSNRSTTSHYEMHIVTSLAYFLATSHALLLDVMRVYLCEHVWVRVIRIFFTVAFLILLTSVYIVDYLFTLVCDGGPITSIRCLIYALSYQDVADSFDGNLFVQVLPVLILLWGKHMSAIVRICSASDSRASDGRHTTAMLLNYLHLHLQS